MKQEQWAYKPASWWQFWLPQSGFIGGSINGAIIGSLIFLLTFLFVK